MLTVTLVLLFAALVTATMTLAGKCNAGVPSLLLAVAALIQILPK